MPRGSKPGERRGGRKRGTPNKTTADVRSAIATFAQDNVQQMSAWLNDIEDPAKRLDLFLRALEYHVPKLGRTEISGKDGGPLVVNVIRYADPAERVSTEGVSTPPPEVP